MCGDGGCKGIGGRVFELVGVKGRGDSDRV